MNRFTITFGVRYHQELHPVSPLLINPNGYVTVLADTEEEAREIVCSNFGMAWAFLYEENRGVNAEYYPLGNLATLTRKARCAHCGTALDFKQLRGLMDGGWVHEDNQNLYCNGESANSPFTATPESVDFEPGLDQSVES